MIFGTFFLLLGVSILLRAFFGWNIPLVRTACALLLIYLGVRMLVGGSWRSHEMSGGWSVHESDRVIFDRGDFRFDKDARNHYSTIFGSSTIDLTQVPADAKDAAVHIETVFGETKVLIDPKIPITIRVSAAFGEARMPNGDMVAFGTQTYRTPDKAEPQIRIRGNVVFGSLRFVPATAAGASSPAKADDASDED
jgi:hypothetical protein